MNKWDWRPIQEDQGIELMLMLNDLTMDDVQAVEFPYPDDWYDNPEMMGPPMEGPSELWLKHDHSVVRGSGGLSCERIDP